MSKGIVYLVRITCWVTERSQYGAYKMFYLRAVVIGREMEIQSNSVINFSASDLGQKVNLIN